MDPYVTTPFHMYMAGSGRREEGWAAQASLPDKVGVGSLRRKPRNGDVGRAIWKVWGRAAETSRISWVEGGNSHRFASL